MVLCHYKVTSVVFLQVVENKGGSGGSGGSGGGNDYKARDYYNMMTGTGTTAKSATGDTYRSKNIAKGAVS